MIDLKTSFKHNFTAALQTMEASLTESVLRATGYAGAKLLQEEAEIRHSPNVKTGTLKRNIIVKRVEEESESNQRQTYMVTVRTGKHNKEGDAYYWRWVEGGHRVVRRPKKGKGSKSMKLARQASELEYGTARKGARPFLRPAWEANKNRAIERMRERMQEKIREYLEAHSVR
jgi:HK97 gp10 family phage protein